MLHPLPNLNSRYDESIASPKAPRHSSSDNTPPGQVTGFVRVVLPLLKPATFALGEVIVTPKIGTREMSFIICGEVEVNDRLKLAAATAARDSM